jgi:hypothetical protein
MLIAGANSGEIDNLLAGIHIGRELGNEGHVDLCRRHRSERAPLKILSTKIAA